MSQGNRAKQAPVIDRVVYQTSPPDLGLKPHGVKKSGSRTSVTERPGIQCHL